MLEAQLKAEVQHFIKKLADGASDPGGRDALLAKVATHQAARVPAYGRLVDARNDPQAALPVDVFRHARIASHPIEEDTRVFKTSGTTSGLRGQHVFKDLEVYRVAAQVAAKHALFPDCESMALVILAPHEDEAPESSLSFMLSRFAEWFGSEVTWVWTRDHLDTELLAATLKNQSTPVALLGTSFAFVHAEDALGERFELPKGSRIMQTGGFKGKSRELDPEAMLTMLSHRYGISQEMIVAEYGMTELSSQMYETTLMDALNGTVRPRHLWVPGWVRVSVRDPETLLPTEGRGILRIDDLANLHSVSMLQTADLAEQISPQGIRLFGRAKGAMPRGCSLSVEEALATR